MRAHVLVAFVPAVLGACSGPARAPSAAGAAPLASAQVPARATPGPAATPRLLWSERFDAPSLDWVDPFDHAPALLAKVYEVRREPEGHAFLHALHVRSPGAEKIPAMHFGKAWKDAPVPLDQVRALAWKWRVRKHPARADDTWLDVAAGVYVIVRTPSLLVGGKGFKFGWLGAPGPRDTYQHGLLQIPLRAGPADDAWHAERVDLCALYREHFGPCENEALRYVGVVTDADGTRSVAEAEYADFELWGE